MLFLPYKWPIANIRGYIEYNPYESFPLERYILYIYEHYNKITRHTEQYMKYIDSDNKVKEWSEYRRRDDDSSNLIDIVRAKWPKA